MTSKFEVRQARRYVQPLREGGSLPAVVDTDDGLFVVKFRGAGQGSRALLAELIVGQLARELGLPTPELALIEIAELFGRSEPDPEIQDILRGSHGLNVGVRYLDGAFNFDAHAAGELIGPDFAADLVWFDAYLTNPDRTARNPNLLVWQRRPWLIDHGAALYAHHDWSTVDEERTRSAFPLTKDHVLLKRSGDIEEADARLAPRIVEALLRQILESIPAELLTGPDEADAGIVRDRYLRYLLERLRERRGFVAEAVRARTVARTESAVRLEARR